MQGDKTWVGTVTARWVWVDMDNEKDELVFQLYVTELPNGKEYRSCTGYGYQAYSHTVYTKYIVPWLDGAPKAIMRPVIGTHTASYWDFKKDQE